MVRTKPVIGITTDVKEEIFGIEMSYVRTIAESGGIPLLLPSIPQSKELFQDIVATIDGLLLPGSRDMDPKYYNEEPHPKLRPMHPERTQSEMIIIKEALNQNIPILGICGGMQTINVFFGGSLYQDIPSLIPNAYSHEMGAFHDILVEQGSFLHQIIAERTFSVKSYHHQAIKALGSGLKVGARCPADGVIEAIECSDSFILGLQWHPEREKTEASKRIFKAFVDKCMEKTG